MSSKRVNCKAAVRLLRWECGRMIVATVVAEFVVAGVFWVFRG